MTTAEHLLRETEVFNSKIKKLTFSGSVFTVYNPLFYAIAPYTDYVKKFGNSKKRVLFLGMNPGPWGMAQNGIPFGERESVTGWLKITGNIGRPAKEHEKRPITGWDCPRSEVSGKRFWGLMKERFGTPGKFFTDHFVANYCPLVFMGETGRNITPDKLLRDERKQLLDLCDTHIAKVIEIFSPKYLIGIGKFAEKRLAAITKKTENSSTSHAVVSSIIHPSPANPQAHKDWNGKVSAKMISLGIWNR